MDLGFLKYCHRHLTGNQFAVFSVLHALGECVTTQVEIAEIMDAGSKRVNFHMVALRRLGFIDYQALGWMGIDLFWVRQDTKPRPIGRLSDLRKAYRWKFVHESGETVRLKQGEIAEFARQRQLRAESVRYLIRGQWQQYKGWSIAA